MAPRIDVLVPATFEPERRYAVAAVLGDLLGLDHAVRCDGVAAPRLRIQGDPAELVLADDFFAQLAGRRLSTASLPREPLAFRRFGPALGGRSPADGTLPILYPTGGEPRPLFEHDAGLRRGRLGVDVFGTAFFCLTRYEEAVAAGERDRHERFPARASLLQRAAMLERPIVDEHVEVLRAALTRVWPRIRLERRTAGVWLTHDVDWPLVAVGRPVRRVVRSAAGDVVRRRAPGLAARRLGVRSGLVRRSRDRDPGNTFDFLMATAERAGLRASFNLLAGGTTRFDGSYRLDDPWIRGLLRRIVSRGHELGFHASYEAFRDGTRLRSELVALRAAAAELGVHQERWGGRQHYLRWANPVSWRLWADAGLDYDSSVYFAEAPGFRTGTCRSYRVFDLAARRPLPLRERPLTLMDVSASGYLRLGHEQTVELAARLVRSCRAHGGTCVLLWHNDAVMTAGRQRLYEDVVEEVTARG